MKRIRPRPPPARFAEFVDGRLDLVEDGKAVLSIPLADIVAVGESTDSGGPWSDDHFLVVRYREAGEEKEMELPFNERSGVGDACTGLLRALGAPPVLPLLNCTHPASVFLWPPDKAGSPVWPDYGPTHSVGSDRDFARWCREHDHVLRRRMPALRTLLCLVCLGIPLFFVAVLAGAALESGPTGLGRIPGACFFYGIVCGLPALFVLSRFAVVEIARTPQRGYRRRVLLCGIPLSVRTVPEGRLVRVQEEGTGGWHGVSGITPSARLCVARADGHHLLLGRFPCSLFGLDALPEAAFAPLGADDPDDRPAVDGAPPAWVEETLPPHTGTRRGERRREAVVRARAEVLAGLEPDDALALRAGNAFARMFAFAFLPFVAGIVALVVVGCLRPVPSWAWLVLFVAYAAGVAWMITCLRRIRCPRCGAQAVPVRTVERGTRRFWFVCRSCGIYAPGSNIGSGAARATAPAPRTVGAMNADELAAFHARRDEENRKARGTLSYEEWFAERERLAAFLARRGVRGFEHGGLDPSAKRSWRERLHLLSGRLRRGRAFRGDFGLSDDWFENRLFGLQLLSSRMFRSGLLSAIRRHLGSPDNGFAVSIATDFPIVTETVVTARECVTDFAGDAVRKAETLARTDPAARRQLRDLRRLLGGLSPWRRRLRNLACLALAGVLFILVCNLAVLIAAAGRVTPAGHAAEAPARRAAVVMGCVPKLRGGWDNPYFTARIEAAAALWRAGKVEALVVSGDNHVEWYDEPSEMKKALVAAGVPEDRIVCDYAGFRTLDSVVRAKTIFGLDSFLVVSQDFHVRRAIFLGRCRGLDVRGCAARGVPLGRLSSRTVVREPLARVAAVLDVLLGRRPRFGGPPVPLPGAP